MRDRSRQARRYLKSAGWVFAILVADVIVAKVQVVMGASMPVHMGDTGQFIVLLLAVSLFVVGAILREKQADSEPADQPRQTNEPPRSDRE